MTLSREKLIKKPRKYGAIDALRGLCVAVMIIYHAVYNAVIAFGLPYGVYSNAPMDAVRWVFAFAFIFLAGFSSPMSRSNLRRGVKCALLALCITAVTVLAGQSVYFGALHLLAVCMLIYAALEALFPAVRARKKRSPQGEKPTAPAILLILMAVTAVLTEQVSFAPENFLRWISWLFGFAPNMVKTADFFPLFPWVFVFFFGAWAGRYAAADALPEKLSAFRAPFFEMLGRRSLLIYIIHAPVLFGIMHALAAI